MASKRLYTDQDKALIRVTLEANQGNVKRTARDLDMPVATVRGMKQKWEREGVPPEVREVLPAVRSNFVEDINRIRDKMALNLEGQVDANRLTPKDNLLGIGILTDKARLVEGKSTSRTEHTGADGSLPVEQVRELFAGFAKGIVEAATARDAAISSATGEEPIDAEWTEQAPLALVPSAP